MAKAEKDPLVAAELRNLYEAAKRAEGRINQVRARRGDPAIRLVIHPQLRRIDPSNWKGKHRVPEMLLRLLLEGMGLECKTNKERHELMIRAAVSRAGGEVNNDCSVSVWSRQLTGYTLKNCIALLEGAGYVPARADTRLSDFVRLIMAGRPARQLADRLGKTLGEGIHAVTFFSANDMLYRGVRYNVQWSKQGKKCSPLLGSGTARGGGKRGGLLKILKDSVTRTEWPLIKQLAHGADQMRAAREVATRLAAARAEARREQDVLLSGLFETSDTGVAPRS
ncbi:hypothetical protein ACRUKS_07850 [Burkholderia pseudomallei]|uniref:hypothetical protein n=1 Tax=Burkholderia pseudomallei TaxID=28450 RepID=UPI0005E869D1|nr:hypothetical protein [Burkholderia pseudomallei]MBD2979265.1 hypothetical protein [Burkholderia pseudomallei]MBD3012150.1 hypothetical protein [Burkholderia pseudomallei]MBF3388417.1 hypothetical protein [Burkholderia pseudomallei]MBF3393619.1 hypothetical protein [Burkholderia pseudomallei]MBF3401923.1 hypothetical protein [Burkholderia pseudomallei]